MSEPTAPDGSGLRLRAGLTQLRGTVTAGGWTLLVMAASAVWCGLRYDWIEFVILGLACGSALAIGLAAALLPRAVEVGFRLRPSRTVVGVSATAELTVRAGLLPLAYPVLTAGHDRVAIRFPFVLPHRAAVEQFALPTHRRGVFTVGPVRRRTGDLLGLVTRDREVAPGHELVVHPQTVALPPVMPGRVVDLEGVASEHLSPADLAFHALREYVPGDDLRHVHWRSSAKHGTAPGASLLVRQYQETRRASATVLLDADAGAYASDDEFELAVSVAASVALRAVQDECDVLFVCGGQAFACSGEQDVLDGAARLEAPAARSDPGEQALAAARAGIGASFVALISGAGSVPATLSGVGRIYGPDVQRVVLRVLSGAEPRVHESNGQRMMELGRLADLPALVRDPR